MRAPQALGLARGSEGSAPGGARARGGGVPCQRTDCTREGSQRASVRLPVDSLVPSALGKERDRDRLRWVVEGVGCMSPPTDGAGGARSCSRGCWSCHRQGKGKARGWRSASSAGSLGPPRRGELAELDASQPLRCCCCCCSPTGLACGSKAPSAELEGRGDEGRGAKEEEVLAREGLTSWRARLWRSSPAPSHDRRRAAGVSEEGGGGEGEH